MSEFHVEHNARPEIVRAVLYAALGAGTEQLEAETGRSIKTVQRMLPMIRRLGLLADRGQFAATDLGQKVISLSEGPYGLFPESVHHLLYTVYAFEPSKRFSWAYAQVVDFLWKRGEVRLESSIISQIVGQVVQDAVDVFGVSVEKVAFSADSVRGVLNWLRALEPAVIEDSGKTTIFKRRYFCPIVAFLWAVDFLYRTSDTPHGVRLFLSPERSDQLCRLCVLDPSGLHNVVMMAKRTTDYQRGGVFDAGTEGGFGRWILLAKPFPVGEVL